MAFEIQKSWKDRYELVRERAKRAAEKAKQGAHIVIEAGVGVGVAGGCGALDFAKGVNKPNDGGFRQHYLGPVPTSAAVGALGLVGSLMMPMNSLESKVFQGVANGGLCSWSYVQGQRVWQKHQQNAGK